MSVHSYAEMEARLGAAMLLAVKAEQGRKLRPEEIRRNERRNAILDLLRAKGPQYSQCIITHLNGTDYGGSRSTFYNHIYALERDGLVIRHGGERVGESIMWEAAP